MKISLGTDVPYIRAVNMIARVLENHDLQAVLLNQLVEVTHSRPEFTWNPAGSNCWALIKTDLPRIKISCGLIYPGQVGYELKLQGLPLSGDFKDSKASLALSYSPDQTQP